VNDLLKTALQSSGEMPHLGPVGITVWELVDLVESLGLDPRRTWVRDGRVVITDERRVG
jgi:hypothetical protein